MGVSIPPMDRKIEKMCDNQGILADCVTLTSTWRIVTFGFCGMTALISCLLLISLMSLYRQRFSRQRNRYFRLWILVYGHIRLQLCAVLFVLISIPRILHQDITGPGSRDISMEVAGCGIIACEIGVALWIYGTAMLSLELMMRPFRMIEDVEGNIIISGSWSNWS